MQTSAWARASLWTYVRDEASPCLLVPGLSGVEGRPGIPGTRRADFSSGAGRGWAGLVAGIGHLSAGMGVGKEGVGSLLLTLAVQMAKCDS